MKKFYLVLVLVFCVVGLKSQTFEKVNTTLKSKSEFCTITKMFISENFKTVNSIVQDVDGGLVLVKTDYMVSNCNYSYSMKFLIRDNQYKVIIFDIKPKENNLSRRASFYSPEFGKEYPGFFKSNVSKKYWSEVQSDIPVELNKLLVNYDTYLKNSSIYNW